MYAHVNTYRLGSADEVAREIAASDDYTISDQTARTIASWYHSPAPRDRNLTALSHGLPFDTDELRQEVERDLSDAGELLPMLDWIDQLETILAD